MKKITKFVLSIFINFIFITTINSMENAHSLHIENSYIRENSTLDIEKAQSKQDFINWIEAEEVKVWDAFHEFYGITRAQCQDYKERCKIEYEGTVEDTINEIVQNNTIEHRELNKNVNDIIDEVFADFGLDKDLFQIIPYSKHAFSSAIDNVVLINQSYLSGYLPRSFKKYSIALAISSAIKQDHSTDFILSVIRENKGLQRTRELIHVMVNYQIFKAIRSDIQVMLLGKEYRDAQNWYYMNLMNQSDYSPSRDDMPRRIIGELMTKALDNP